MLVRVSTWLAINKMDIAPDKIKCVIIGETFDCYLIEVLRIDP